MRNIRARMRTLGAKGGRASSRAANRPENVDLVRRSTEDDRWPRTYRIARTRSLPTLLSRYFARTITT
jgi:hypothetical protein